MIRIKPYTTTWDSGFIVEGHAEYEEHGKDIVCASISAIAHMTFMGIRRYSGTKHFMKDGYMSVEVYKRNDACVHALLHAFLIGVRDIAEQLPDYVSVESADFESKE